MTCIELDQRSVAFLTTKLPGIDIIHKDVLLMDWPELASKKGASTVHTVCALYYTILYMLTILYNLLTCFYILIYYKGGPVNIIANLPYNIVSQVLFSLADSYKAIDQAIVTMQWEVALRICASPNTKDYGIPSVVFQL